MSDFEVSKDYKLQTLNQRLEALNIEGWHNEEARLIAKATANTDEVTRLASNIATIKIAIEAVKKQITDLA